MERARTGAALATVLMVVALASVLVFLCAGIGTYHLQLSTRLENREHARNLAEGALNLALAEISQNQNFGTPGTTVRYSPGAGLPEGAEGVVSFDALPGLPRSTNNLANPGAVSADDGVVVPGGTVRLVARGRCAGAESLVECFFYRPPSPNGIVVSGKIRADGLFLAGVAEVADFPGSYAAVDPDKKRPSNVLSNNTADDALVLRASGGQPSEVFGNVEVVGRADLEAGSLIRGEVRQGVSPNPVPEFDIDSLITQVEAVNGLWPYPNTEDVSGVQVFGSSQVFNSDLVMNDSVLCVRGDLRVRGALRGRGIVLVTGSVQIDEGSAFSADDLVAVAAKRSVSLRGDGRASYFFNGLLYSEEEIEATDLTVLGTVVCNGSSADEGNLRLTRVNLIQTRISASIAIGMPLPGFTVNGFEEMTDVRDDTWIIKVDRIGFRNGEPLYQLTLWFEFDASDLIDGGDGGYDIDVTPENWNTSQAMTSRYGTQPLGPWTREELLQNLGSIFRDLTNIQNEVDYTTDVGLAAGFIDEFRAYLDNLEQANQAMRVFSLDLNRVLTPVSGSRVTVWRPLER